MNYYRSLVKFISSMLILTLLLGSITVLAIPGNGAQPQPLTVQKGEDFTHDVLLELFVTTWCQYCPSAEEVAKQLSGEYGEHFVFVTMVTDDDDHGGNGKAQERSDDYQVQAIPDGVFDGNYRREIGGQSDSSTYEGHIDDSGNRDVVANVDLSVDVVDNGDGTMEVSYTAKYTDAFPFFDARLRVYIAERVSRWPDKEGHSIPYGFIDYAFDEDVRLPTQVDMEDSVTWRFDDYENATFDNFVIVAGLFDKSTGVERYVVQSAITETTNIVISDISWDPKKPKNTDEMTFRANVTGDVAEVEVEYAICTEGSCGANQYATMEIEEGDIYSAKVGDFGSDAVDVIVSIIGRDSSGNEVKSETYEIYFNEGSGGSGQEKEDWVENDPVFYGGVGLLVVGFLAVGLPLISRKRAERNGPGQSGAVQTATHPGYPAFGGAALPDPGSGEEEYVDAENL